MKEILTLKRKGLESSIKEEFPQFEIVDKRESPLMMLLSKLLFFNKAFMTKFVTVIGNKVYVPQVPWKEDDPSTACEVLAHEWVHMKDGYKLGPIFKFLYLFPQILTPLALLGFINPLFFLFVLCALPIPAPFRAYFEFRAYVVTIAVRYWILSQPTSIEWLVSQFTSSSYYWMLPAKKFLTKKFTEEYIRICKDELHPYEREIKKALKI